VPGTLPSFRDTSYHRCQSSPSMTILPESTQLQRKRIRVASADVERSTYLLPHDDQKDGPEP